MRFVQLSNSQNALSLTVPSGVVADLSMANRVTGNNISTSPQITLNGLGANSNIVNGNVNGANMSPATTGTSNLMIASSGTSTPGTGGGGKGGKGIRNRVFCGECPGCLQNVLTICVCQVVGKVTSSHVYCTDLYIHVSG